MKLSPSMKLLYIHFAVFFAFSPVIYIVLLVINKLIATEEALKLAGFLMAVLFFLVDFIVVNRQKEYYQSDDVIGTTGHSLFLLSLAVDKLFAAIFLLIFTFNLIVMVS